MTSKELSKWSDGFMFKAEDSLAAEGPKVYLLGGPQDPLGQIAACAKMYKGEVVRDLRDVTDAERREYLEQIQKTVLKMPLEAVQLHFMVEGVTRSFTHQMVRQRTAAYAQESMRFAVKEDAATAVALPPSLEGTLTLDELVERDIEHRREIGLQIVQPGAPNEDEWFDQLRAGLRTQALEGKFGKAQRHRILWDEEVRHNADVYLDLVNDGMPAEDARGLTLHNITTRLNYITNLRSWYDTMAVRVSDQAQFEWRAVAMHMALALREFGERTTYELWVRDDELNLETDRTIDTQIDDITGAVRHLVRRSSYWQYEALSNELKPIEFKLGKRAFGANFDRPSRIGERVDAFAKYGVPSEEWTRGSVEHGIPPIHPEEWLLDPNSARLPNGMEFDIFGNRVPVGTGLHYVDHGVIGRIVDGKPEAYRWPRDFQDGVATHDNKPGQSDEDVDALIAEIDES